jgi:hypothetical protein
MGRVRYVSLTLITTSDSNKSFFCGVIKLLMKHHVKKYEKINCSHMFCRACSTVQAKGEGILWPLANTKSFKNMSNYSEINLGIIATKGEEVWNCGIASKNLVLKKNKIENQSKTALQALKVKTI